ncbi:hypothetical protein T440DRAFT_471858 [Plenodomus tracheiphilus IPT5]|uniref:Uncharacterized protein n=1 Tax=Plenodomus tracheiphilus IPT5 TaxID=1408161 RepID=A0A6A7ASX2_9PLEO|nr:hypothetical protein T440DRAFT_471858 [Plenodomus tracheiphilus IPT5]
MEEQGSNETTADTVYEKAKASRFHFKSGSKHRSRRAKSTEEDGTSERSSKRPRSEKYDDDGHHSKRESRRRHKHKHRSSYPDRHPTSTLDGAYYDPDYRHRESLYDDINTDTNPTTSNADLPPDSAFRESLFDALADDEGAAYWEGVYGQPVHIYPDTKPGPNGTLERMNEEEYADYVRTKMWEKSHQHIVQEREAKEQARRKRKEQRRHLNEDIEQEDAERDDIRRRMEESLRRGEERKRAKEGEAAWSSYLAKWENLKLTTHNLSSDKEYNINVSDLIPWPVLSGKAKHVNQDAMERFWKGTQAWRDDEVAVLKVERVRWHPDKMQQRFGRLVDAQTMRLVTAVFQVVDRLWNERR